MGKKGNAERKASFKWIEFRCGLIFKLRWKNLGFREFMKV